MTERLCGALAEIGERAPVAHVPDDTWTRARRARRRELAGSVAALVLLVAGAAGVVGSLRHDSAPIAAGGVSGAVPSHIYGVPDRLTLTDGRSHWTGPVEHDLAIGRSSVAYATSTGLPVVVTAADGGYHLLDLPGFLGKTPAFGFGAGLALSPDGRSLAYGYAGAASVAGSPHGSGVRVLDLTTGAIRTIALPSNRQGTSVQVLSWSPDSRWLAWSGQVATSWTTDSATFRGQTRGVIPPGSGSSTALPAPRDAAATIAVADDGTVALLTSQRLRLLTPPFQVSAWFRGQSYRVRLPSPLTGGNDPARLAFAFDGPSLAIASTSPKAAVYVLQAYGQPVTPLRLVSRGPDGATSQPLGSMSDGQAVFETALRNGDTTTSAEIVVTAPPQMDVFADETRTVAVVDSLIPGTLSVATDLMTSQHPTRDFPAPTWPWPTDQKIAVGLAAGLGAAGMAWLVLKLVRRRRLLPR